MLFSRIRTVTVGPGFLVRPFGLKHNLHLLFATVEGQGIIQKVIAAAYFGDMHRDTRRLPMIRGRVRNGVVVLEAPSTLREGTVVAVEPISRQRDGGKTKKQPTVHRALSQLAGKAKGLPPDAARNVDHYLYGHEKQ
jgi:hypothetical protein